MILYLEKQRSDGIALGWGSRRALQQETPRAGGFADRGRTSARQEGQQQQW